MANRVGRWQLDNVMKAEGRRQNAEVENKESYAK